MASGKIPSVKEYFAVLIFLSAVINCISSAKLSGSTKNHHHRVSRNAAPSPDSSLETLLLRDKLNLILDAESREVTLLKNLLDESHDGDGDGEERKIVGAGVDESVEKNELDKSYKSQSDSWTTATSPATTTTSTTTTSPEKVTSSYENVHSLAYLREHGIVSKLEENSKRMEKMVVFLVDLRNLLTEALTAHARETAFETEMVEIREEMEYLRRELQTLKKEKTSSTLSSNSRASFAGSEASTSGNNMNLENKLHNDEATIEWLKESTKELRSQMSEISASCNMSVMVQMKDQMEKDSGRRDAALAAAEKELESLRLKQLRQEEQISEAKGNIEDLRSWQVKMGQKLIENKSTTQMTATTSLWPESSRIHDEIDNDDDGESQEERSNSVQVGGGEEERFITEALKEAVGKPLRHGKRLKAKVHELQTIIQDLVRDNKNYHKRLVKIENSQRFLKIVASNLRETLTQFGLIGSSSASNDVYRSGSKTSVNVNMNNNHHNSNNGQLSKRMGSLEKTMQEYVITLENLNDKVSVVEELQESSTQLFRALETLETKYDERVTELQTGLARLESSVSSTVVVNEDLKEQQTQQSGVIQSVKKDLFQMKGKLQTNHLRLASIQSQMVKWASQKCSDESTESIQNIRIATLEHALLDVKRSQETTENTEFS